MMNGNKNQKYGGKRRKGSKSNSKQTYKTEKATSRYGSEVSDNEANGRGGNHISWYVPDPNMLSNVANVPFSFRTGDVLHSGLTTDTFGEAGSEKDTVKNTDFYMPGIACGYFTPTYGDLSDPRSAGNVASTAVYSWIRHANSGSRNYDNVDLMLYLLAMDSVYMGITTLQRFIGLAMYYNRWSTYTPEAIAKALGMDDFADFQANLAEARYRLNAMILKASTLAVPSTFPIFTRHAYMCSSLYMDEPNDRAQYYAYVPTVLWRFGLDDKQLGRLRAVTFCKNDTSAPREWRDLFRVVEDCINMLYGDEDSGIMSGDILKAYGKENLVTLSTITSELTLLPIYDHQMLVQFHNGVPWGDLEANDVAPAAYPEIKQENSDLSGGPYLVNSFKFVNGIFYDNDNNTPSLTLDLHNEISPENVMEATRLMSWNAVVSTGPALQDLEHTTFGSEVMNRYNIFTWNLDKPDSLAEHGFAGIGPKQIKSGTLSAAALTTIAVASTFSLFPLIYMPYSSKVWIPTGNMDKVTSISFQNLKSLHNVAMLGLFNVPRLSFGLSANS